MGGRAGTPGAPLASSEEAAHFEKELAVIVISDAPSKEQRAKQRLEQKSDGCILRELSRVRRLTVGLARLVHRQQNQATRIASLSARLKERT